MARQSASRNRLAIAAASLGTAGLCILAYRWYHHVQEKRDEEQEEEEEKENTENDESENQEEECDETCATSKGESCPKLLMQLKQRLLRQSAALRDAALMSTEERVAFRGMVLGGGHSELSTCADIARVLLLSGLQLGLKIDDFMNTADDLEGKHLSCASVPHRHVATPEEAASVLLSHNDASVLSKTQPREPSETSSAASESRVKSKKSLRQMAAAVMTRQKTLRKMTATHQMAASRVQKESTSVRERDTSTLELVVGSGSSKPGVQIASDIHLEMVERSGISWKAWLESSIVPSAPVLVLLGDVGTPSTVKGREIYTEFLTYQASRFELVLVLTGNHEYYVTETQHHTHDPHTVAEIDQAIADICTQVTASCSGRVKFMRNRTAVLNGQLRLACSTLWSHVPDEHRPDVLFGLNDYSFIFLPNPKKHEKDGCVSVMDLDVRDTNKWHQESLAYLTREIEAAKSNGQTLFVMTHHAPSFVNTADPAFKEEDTRFGFASNLEGLFTGVDCWAFGHTHWCSDQAVAGTRLVSNQMGYAGAKLKPGQVPYDPALVLTA